MYSLLIKDYERRNKDLILENGDLKELAGEIIEKFMNLLLKYKLIHKNHIDFDIDTLVTLPWTGIRDIIDKFIKLNFSKLDESLNRTESDCLNSTFTINDASDESISNQETLSPLVNTTKFYDLTEQNNNELLNESKLADAKRNYLKQKLILEEEKARLNEALKKLSVEVSKDKLF